MSPSRPFLYPAAAELRELRLRAGLTQDELGRELDRSGRTIKRWESGEVAPEPLAIEYLRRRARRRVREPRVPDFTFIDLFAGIGGMRLGFEAVGGRCVFTSEWDRWAQKTYRANFGDEPIHGDITQVPLDEIPDHDVLLAGFPCQPFSIAGVSKKNALGRPHGFECTTQGTLFFEIEKILRARRPTAFLLENVKNLQAHDQGRTFRTIMRVLQQELGYTVRHRIIDARCFVPQHRERVFLVGFREDRGFDFSQVALPDRARWPTLRAVLHSSQDAGRPEEGFTDRAGRPLAKYTLSDGLWRYLKEYAARHEAKGNGFGFGLVGPDDVARTLSARYYKDGSEILVRRSRGNPRRLTPRECARLMGFDFGSRQWRIVVSDTQAYRQFGNAVVPPVVEAIARAMKPLLLGQLDLREQLPLPIAS